MKEVPCYETCKLHKLLFAYHKLFVMLLHYNMSKLCKLTVTFNTFNFFCNKIVKS